MDHEGYSLNSMRGRDWELSHAATQLRMILNIDEINAIHFLAAKLDTCSDERCPCWQSGYQQAQESVGDWHRPMWA